MQMIIHAESLVGIGHQQNLAPRPAAGQYKYIYIYVYICMKHMCIMGLELAIPSCYMSIVLDVHHVYIYIHDVHQIL